MSGHKLRAVLDTSVLVAGVSRPDGPSGQVLRAFRRGLFTHVTSSAILDEMVDVLTREKIQRLTQFSRQDIANLRVATQQRAETASNSSRAAGGSRPRWRLVYLEISMDADESSM